MAVVSSVERNTTMGNNSILVSKPNYFYQTTADEHLLICKTIQHQKAKSRANFFCMSKLLSTIAYWTDKRRDPDNESKDLGVFFTLDQWRILLREEHCKQAIIDSLDALVQANFLTLRKEFRPGGGKPHNIYYLQADTVNKKILALPDIDPFDIFPKVTYATNSKVTNGTTEAQSKVTNGTIKVTNGTTAKSQMLLLKVPNVTTNPNYKSITTNQDTTNQSKVNARANASAVTQKNALQKSLFSSEETGEQEQGKKPTNKRSKRVEQELKEITLPDLTQTPTRELLLQQADFYRGCALPTSERSDSKYQRALKEGVQPLLTRSRRGGKVGYSLQEIDSVYKLLLRLNEEDWLVDETWNYPVDIWVIAKNIDSKLLLIEKLRRQHAPQQSGAAAPGSADNNPFQSGNWANVPTVTGRKRGTYTIDEEANKRNKERQARELTEEFTTKMEKGEKFDDLDLEMMVHLGIELTPELQARYEQAEAAREEYFAGVR